MISAQKGCKHSFRVQNPKYVGSSKLRRNKQLGTSTVEEEDTRYEKCKAQGLGTKTNMRGSVGYPEALYRVTCYVTLLTEKLTTVLAVVGRQL